MSLVGFLIIWILFASGVGWAFATIESKVNKTPKRLKSAIALSVCLGVVGWVILAMRSGMRYAGGMREDQRVTAEAARRMMAQPVPPVAEPPVADVSPTV